MKTLTKIVLDTEFTSLTQESQLLSLALVAETGEKFYAEFNDFKKKDISTWIENNVINNFLMNDEETHFSVNNKTTQLKGDKEYIVEHLRDWLKQFVTIEMWADVPHYDWVLFCELFGGSMNLPKNLHFMCLDLATLLCANGIDYKTDRISLIDKNEMPKNYSIHNALSDAELTLILVKKYSHGKN